MQAETLRLGGERGEREGDAALVSAARVLDGDHGGLGNPTGIEQTMRDQTGGGDAHVNHERILPGLERGKIEMGEARLAAAGFLAGEEGDAVRDVAMGERDLQAGGGGERSGDAGDDLDVDAGSAQSRDLLAGAAKDERVPALQPHDGLAGGSVLDHQRLDLLLRHAMGALRLADRDQLCLAAGVLENLGAGEPVVEDDVGGLQRPHGFQRQEIRIAWPGADKQHAAGRSLQSSGLYDGLANQTAGICFVAGEHGLRGVAVENRFPELPAGAACRKLLGDAIAEFAGEPRKPIEPKRQFALEPGTQPLRQNRSGAFGADGDGHLAAIDDRRHDETAERGLVGHIHRHTERPRDRRDSGILFVLARGGNHQRPAAHLIDAGKRRQQRDTAFLHEGRKRRHDAVSSNVDGRRPLQEQARLDGGKLAAANHERRLAIDGDEDRKSAHG